MTRRRHSSVSFDGFAIPVRHAHWGYLAGEAYNTFTKRYKSMAPINKPFASKAFHDESYGGIAISSESWVTVHSGNSPLKRVLKQGISYRDQYGLEIEWVSNTSKFTTISGVGTKEQYNTNTLDTQFVRWGAFYKPAFDFNPNQLISGGALVAFPLGPSVNDWVGLSHGTTYYDFLNHTNLPCYVKVHWFKALMTTSDQPWTDFSQSTDATPYQFVMTYPGGVAAPLNSGSEKLISSTIGSASVYPNCVTQPYTNLLSRSQVTKNWKKLKTKTFTLQSGASHRMTVNQTYNMFQSKSALIDESSIPKGAVICVVETQGAPSHLREAVASPTYDGPTIGPGKISVVVTRKIVIKPMKNSTDRFDLTYSGRGNVLMNGTVPNTNVINDVDMDPEPGQQLQ